jgi:hypothetical protein
MNVSRFAEIVEHHSFAVRQHTGHDVELLLFNAWAEELMLSRV